jgi:predicted TIM-barrel fold metal-dependent hydrolase
MAKNGFRIFDSDTHIGPHADVLERYLSESEKRRLDSWEPWKFVDPRNGHSMYTRYARKFLRVLGRAEAEKEKKRTSRDQAVRKHAKEEDMPRPQAEVDPAERIKDMDREGVDVNLTLPSSWFGTFTADEDVELEAAMYRAYHRWMVDYCGTFPARIKGVIIVCARDIERSLQELERRANEDWALAAFVYAPSAFPLDHPDLEPVWAACQHHNLSIALHTFTQSPPYAPGGQDTWGNHFLQRCAAHSWCGERNIAALIGAGVMDRYPKLRIAPLEAGHSWLPFWMTRMDEHAQSHAEYLPPLKMKPSEYVLSGRYFQSIEMSEGEKLTKSVIDLIGEDILMYASDYPHRESWFPKSVETVMAWDLPTPTKRKLFWDNAVKYYARYPSD